MVTGMYSHEELMRLLYPSFRINKELGGKIKVASLTDMSGPSWGLPTVMSGAGINYFFGGMPTYFEWGNGFPGSLYPDNYTDLVKHTFWDEKNILRLMADLMHFTGKDQTDQRLRRLILCRNVSPEHPWQSGSVYLGISGC